MSVMTRDLNDLAFWHPAIEGIVPTPKTVIVKCESALSLQQLAFGEEPEDLSSVDSLVDQLLNGIETFGLWPAFLRSGHTSAKHSWRDTCFVPHYPDTEVMRKRLGRAIVAIVEYGEMVSMIGLPVETWCVREFLSGTVHAELPGFGGMLAVPELRVFADSDKVTHVQHYWPAEALAQGGATDPEALHEALAKAWSSEQIVEALGNAVKCAKACNEAAGLNPDHEWSVDSFLTHDGKTYVTDMAVGAESYRYGPPAPSVQTGDGR